MPIEVIVADDRDIIRSAIRRLLGADPEIAVVGEAETLDEAIRLADQMKPHLVVMDLYLTQKTDRGECPAARIAKSIPRWIAVSFANDEAAHRLAKGAGAITLLDKIELSEQLIPAIRSTALA